MFPEDVKLFIMLSFVKLFVRYKFKVYLNFIHVPGNFYTDFCYFFKNQLSILKIGLKIQITLKEAFVV